MDFAIGQRWVSHADTELGLGVVTAVESRRVCLHFPAVSEERTYAADNAPLSRMRLDVGDTLRTAADETFEILDVTEEDGVLFYAVRDGNGARQLPELELNHHIELDSPRQRLLAAQVDSHAAFTLRAETLRQLDRLRRSSLRGLLGTRTSLLPHQLYVASEVGRRHAPRVLLADEVGLGKTIEAGMILHRQLLTGATQRVLILVPESLQHQWLIEMRRRFNLAFALFDEERIEDQPTDNPFESEQLVLCSLGLLDQAPEARSLLADAPWDLVVVDEAHRISWSEDGTSQSEDFRFLQELALRSPGLLLLTATPEQVGQAAHFARLSLLDPARFRSLEAFRSEEARYRQWSELIDAVERGEHPAALPEDIDRKLPGTEKIRRLIDRYGTGRVLFRNTRAAVGNFPRRRIRRRGLSWDTADPSSLYPENNMSTEEWLAADPRISWLIELLRELRPAKVLVICAQVETAIALESHLQLRAGIRAAAFHEKLNLLERDRAAAWFADEEQGAQALVCSEIGSEGRNFQFAQHLVLFDLPRHPDQLEQRIGRLDRIGQRDEIFIHAPYLEGTAQEKLLRWYDEGLGSLAESCSAGDMILRRFSARLEEQLQGSAPANDLEALLEETAAFTAETRSELREGRDRLLERSSCDPQIGEQLASEIESLEDPEALGAYLERLCAAAGVEHEEHSEHCVILKPGEQERLAVFPELPEDGATVTVSRDIALAREDMAFLSWEHPWLEGAMETVVGHTLGQAAIGSIKLKGVPAGSRIYECLFTTFLAAPRELQLQRYLPLNLQRIVIDGNGRELSALLPSDKLDPLVEKVPRSACTKIVKRLLDEIDRQLQAAQALAEATFLTQQSQALQDWQDSQRREIERLRALQALHGAVRDSEILALEEMLEAGRQALGTASLSLQGLRLIVTR